MATNTSSEGFNPTILGFQQIKSEEEIKIIRQRAEHEHPSLTSDDALLEYVRECEIRDVFFPGTGGRRTCWGRDLKYFKNKRANGYWGQLTEVYASGNRKFLLFDGRPSLQQIDQPKDPRISQMLKHKSEDGWALPTDHDRHLTSFPEDILSLILDHVLVYDVEQSVPICPEVILCNWRRCWCMPHYETESFQAVDQAVVRTPISRVDQHGEFFIIRDVYRAKIDATILRVSKKLHDLGTKKLYGQNCFDFSRCAPQFVGCHPRMSGRPDQPEKLQIWRPSPFRPLRDDEWDVKLEKAMSAIEKQVYYKYLPGWLYYDKFLRFLYEIGPGAAAEITSIRFGGVDSLEDLTSDLEVYLPFLVRFCTSLYTLTLRLWPDVNDSNENLEASKLSEENFQRFLKEQVSKIESLRTLRVEDYCDEVETLSFKDVTAWFGERGRIHEAEEAERSLNRTREYMQNLAITNIEAIE